MRLREFFYLLGLKPTARIYGHGIQVINLPKDGRVEFARWRNPRAPDLALRQSELDELRSFIKEGDAAVDVGAQIGDSTLPIALACGASGQVLAFEPNPMTFMILAANANLNSGRVNIWPIPYAASLDDGPLTFEYGNPAYDNGGDHAGMSRWRHGSAFVLPVEGRRIEPIIRARLGDRVARLRYIKTDVEGHDFKVLRSIEALIDETRPYIKSEMNKYTTPEERVGMHRFLTGKGYRIHRVTEETLFGPEMSESDLAGLKSYDLFAVPPAA
jgi:FkbM family methyltransferase